MAENHNHTNQTSSNPIQKAADNMQHCIIIAQLLRHLILLKIEKQSPGEKCLIQ